MKLIVAYIQPEKLNDVKKELYKAEVKKMSVTNALGCGQQDPVRRGTVEYFEQRDAKWKSAGDVTLIEFR